MPHPNVFILLASFNRAHLIEKTLESIKNQTFEDFTCLIIDDNSTDDSKNVITRYIETDNRFRFYPKLKKYKQGLPDTRNYGLDLAVEQGATHVQFFDDDDLMHPDKLKLKMAEIEKDATVEMVNAKYEGFTTEEDIEQIKIVTQMNIESNNIDEDFLLKKVKLNSCSPLFNISLFSDLRFDNELLYTAEERECFLRVLFLKKPKYTCVNEYLFFYRHHDNSNTTKDKNQLQKIGSFVRVDQKVWDFLESHKLHTPRTISYFLKKFLIDTMDYSYVNKVTQYLKTETSLNAWQKFKIKSAIKFHSLYKRIIYKFIQ